jgi:hypothetical protein
MKERKGFVSNSSSSSFIVHDPNRTTSQIMREMLKLVKAERKEYKTNTRSITKIIKWLQYHPKKDMPLVYPNTCNYETWIFKNKNGFDTLIHTCNNHNCNWESMEFDFRHDDNHEEDWLYMKTLKFLDLADMKEKTYNEYNKEWEERLASELRMRKKK